MSRSHGQSMYTLSLGTTDPSSGTAQQAKSIKPHKILHQPTFKHIKNPHLNITKSAIIFSEKSQRKLLVLHKIFV